MSAHRQAQLESPYASFNARDLDRVLAAMTPDVAWPDGWQRQWAEIRTDVRPTAFAEQADGRLDVTVHQVVRDPSGALLGVTDVHHRRGPGEPHVQRDVGSLPIAVDRPGETGRT